MWLFIKVIIFLWRGRGLGERAVCRCFVLLFFKCWWHWKTLIYAFHHLTEKHVSCMWNLCVWSALMKSPVQTLFFCRCLYFLWWFNAICFSNTWYKSTFREPWAHSKHRAWTFTTALCVYNFTADNSVYSIINIMWGTRKIKKHKCNVKQRLACFLCVPLDVGEHEDSCRKVFCYFYKLINMLILNE